MSMSRLLTLLFMAMTCRVWPPMESKRVVVFPSPHTSHTKYHINIAHELVKLSHEVWLTMPEYLVAKGVLDTSNLRIVEYSTMLNVEDAALHATRDRYFSGKGQDYIGLVDTMKRFSGILLRNNSFFEVIKNIRPHFIIIDSGLVKMFCVIPYRLGVPFAFAGSAFDPLGQRIPFSPVVTPSPILPFTDHMDFTRRLVNTALYFMSAIRDITVYPDAVTAYAPEMPYLPIDMLVARAEIRLVEMDHILDYPRPSVPNVKLIGGTATGPAKPLPAKFQSFMDSATQGVVIVSFGSYVLNLPKELSDKVLQVLQQIPLKSIFRSNLTSPDPEKILTATWIPQNDLLAHPNTKVFFSHCGKNGQYEALYHAVPTVAVPFFGDQPYNAERARVKGFSETVDLKTTTADEMVKVVMQVATEQRYKQAISVASELFRIEFGIPAERAAFWLDHVMKYGGGHMRSAGQDISFYQFVGLDMWITVTACVLFSLSLPLLCCLWSVKWFCHRRRKEKEE